MKSKLQEEKILIIVESPNKVKTISSILKQAGFSKALVTASIGHIITLENGGPAYNSGIYPDQNYRMNLIVTEDKKKVVNDIIKKSQMSDKIFIMTDGDREGEIIAWSLIKFCKLPPEKCFRAITHEITPKAILKAIEHPVAFNDNLVNAGLVRLMIDKLIGYGLSPLGKKYIGAKSIGRCQSVGLKLISDRETEIANFIPELYFNLYLNFIKNSNNYRAKYVGYAQETINKFIKRTDVDAVINDCKNSNYEIEDVQVIKHSETPKLPFCTATFQQEAATKLGLRVKEAMNCAQKLFEGININGTHKGLITYMRTDSTEIASEFLPELENYIKVTFGNNKFVNPRKSKKKTTDQDGHEALRIVDPNLTPEILSSYTNNALLVKVYKLIWQRTIAAAMPNALIYETLYTISNKGHKFNLSAKELKQAGYKSVYEFEDNRNTGYLDSFNVGEILQNASLEVTKKFTQPKARYTEASLVKELQQREIGRPSTYATIVETILSPTRGYTKLEEKHIVPTDRGLQLANYCDRSFSSLINLNYTKNMEENLDRIASGDLAWLDYIETFYADLQKTIKNTNETGIASEMPEKLCPNCGNLMVVRRSRFGRLFYGCSTYPKCNGIVGID